MHTWLEPPDATTIHRALGCIKSANPFAKGDDVQVVMSAAFVAFTAPPIPMLMPG
jgi:hypothetical protein